MISTQQELFGSRRRTEALKLLGSLEESYPSELATLLKAPLYSVQRILADLEDQGIVASRQASPSSMRLQLAIARPVQRRKLI